MAAWRSYAALQAPQRGQAEVLLDGELFDHAAALGHVGDPQPGDRLDRATDERPSVE
jgi:hypothetical protein